MEENVSSQILTTNFSLSSQCGGHYQSKSLNKPLLDIQIASHFFRCDKGFPLGFYQTINIFT